MLKDIAEAMLGRRPFDLVIRNVQIVNVFSASIVSGSIGIVNGHIAGVFGPEEALDSRRSIDGGNAYALPGFVDSHMHLESSMLTPEHFAQVALSCGTTTVCADPHEIANVLGIEGVRGLADACRSLPLRVLLTAPSTIPSAPGLEDSGFDVGPAEMEALLDIPGVAGLGEVMDFNAVAAGDERMLSVIEAAANHGVFLDGHVSALTGRRLQSFRAMGIDSDHTVPSAEKLREELALGFTVQVQECMLNREIVQAMNDAPVQDRICLVTDDVPLPRLMRQGHLNFVVERAIELGLDPIRAIRYATINPAVRLRLYHTGGIAPGMEADMQLVQDLRHPRPELVLRAGEIVWDHGSYLPHTAPYQIPDHLRGSVHLRPVTEADFAVKVPVRPGFSGGTTPDLLNDSDHFAYVIGYMDGNVRPYGLISRAETTTIFFRLLKDSVRDGNLLTSNTYTDVADDYWANTAISTMTGLGIVQGRSTTTFDPKAPITRAQFAAICARFDTGKSNGEQTFSDIQGHWAEKYIERAAELGWIKGFEDGTFRPDTYITRAQAMTMINRVLNRIPEDESDLLPGMNVWPDCNPGDWFYLAVQEATNSHDFEHKAGNYETWTKLMKNPDWTRYEN